MARKASKVEVAEPTFVGTFYSVEHGVYFATRANGTVTVGRIGKRGINIDHGLVTPDALPVVAVEA
ncbi:MAG TPA: hypothetical protein VMR98_06270 [Candidatus Polarisedimenticolaceae bacterium]|nr:hypothetical protein [Candidatus Polarisedimenticolaceae bacterium]